MKSPFFALIRKDMKGYFDQPTGYILIVVFVSMLSWSFFKTALIIGEASLRPLFTVDFAIDKPSLPWLLTIFIPAATMRLLAEEQRDGTLETLLTQPIRGWIVLVSKFCSGLLFVSIAIIATIGIPLSLINSGNLDWGGVVSQYIGSIFLAGSLVAIGLFTSSLTRNQIVAFILGLTVSMALMVMGLEIVAVTLPSNVANLLQLLSPVTHFDNVGRGIIDLRDILYFLALISTFLSATFLIIRSRTLSHKSPQFRNLQLGVSGLIILSLLVGWFGTSIKGRLDLTEDQIFTLSPATIEIVDQLQDLLTIDVYMSKDPPVQVSPVSRDINDFLDDLQSNSDNMVKVIRHYPEDDEYAEKKATLAGVNAVQFNVQTQDSLQIKNGYLGVVLTYLDKREVIPFVDSVDGFEYRLANLTNKMLVEGTSKKVLGLISGHGEKSPENDVGSILSVLSAQYEIRMVSAEADENLDLSGVDIIFIISPSQRIGNVHRDSISNFLDRGGKAFITVEPVSVDLQQLAGLPNRNSFSDYLERFGVLVQEDLVYDLQSNQTLSFPSATGSVYMPYPYWVKAEVTDSKIGGTVGTIIAPWASSIGIANLSNSTYKVTPFLSTSDYASVDFQFTNLRPDSPIFEDTLDSGGVRSDIGVTIEGENGGRIVVTSDSDWISDTVVTRSRGNVLLALNLVDWLAQEDNLAAVRSKVVTQRTLVFSSDTQRNIVKYSNIAGVPLAFIVLGFIRFFQRRSKGFSTRWQDRATRFVRRSSDTDTSQTEDGTS